MPSLKEGLIWNLLSFLVIGSSGIILNYMIANFYESRFLGSFNQVLVLFLIGSQVGTFGVHYSTLYRTSLAHKDPKLVGRSLFPALTLVGALSSVVAIACWALSKPLAQAFDSEAVGFGARCIAPGLLFFPMNKVMLANLNGMRRMKAYAVGNACRYVLVMLAIVGIHQFSLAGDYLPLSLAVAEISLFIGLVVANWGYLRNLKRNLGEFSTFFKEHMRFGARGVLSGMLIEINTRVDVLILGLLLDDAAVGIYSVASVFADGFLQLMMVFRYNYDPVLARMISENSAEELRSFILSGKKMAYLVMLVLGCFAILVYPMILELYQQKEIFQSWSVFTILTLGIAISAGYLPFGGILSQGGSPSGQSVMSGLVLATNVLGNILLIPFFGVIGSAVATAITQACYPVFLKKLTHRNLGFQL